MPELPEVELVRRGLSETIVGRRVEGTDVLSAGVLAVSPDRWVEAVQERRIEQARRRGKLLILGLDSGVSLLVHLMMTGQVVVLDDGRTVFTGGHPSRSMHGPMPNATTRLILRLEGRVVLFFNDARKFGRIRVIESDALLAADPFLRRLGPEPLGDAFTLRGFRAQLERHRRAPTKAVILNQSVVAGVGNIYADEALHLARIHPGRRAGDLDESEAVRLRDSIRRVIELAIDSGGTSFADHNDPNRAPTGYIARARLFHRQGGPCSSCGTPIERLRIAGRATNVCPRCQPLAPGERQATPAAGSRPRRSTMRPRPRSVDFHA